MVLVVKLAMVSSNGLETPFPEYYVLCRFELKKVIPLAAFQRDCQCGMKLALYCSNFTVPMV